MGSVTVTYFCPVCERKTAHQRATANNWLHLVLSVLTVGFWLPLWAGAIFFGIFSRPHCNACNTAYSGREARAKQREMKQQRRAT